MFKIAQLKNVKNETVSISLIEDQSKIYNNNQIITKNYRTLSFKIHGDNYSLYFDLNCDLEKLLDIEMDKTIDFKDYILEGETFLYIKSLAPFEPIMDIKITRYLKNRFIIFLTFYTDYFDDNYSGMIEFSFNLDDYLK